MCKSDDRWFGRKFVKLIWKNTIFSFTFSATSNGKMQKSEEKLRLQWNDFQQNVSSAFGELRSDKDFIDVTLVSEEGQQGHKLVFISSCPFFLNLFKRNKLQHPLLYKRGVLYDNLVIMVDFFYHGDSGRQMFTRRALTLFFYCLRNFNWKDSNSRKFRGNPWENKKYERVANNARVALQRCHSKYP